MYSYIGNSCRICADIVACRLVLAHSLLSQLLARLWKPAVLQL